MKTKRRNSGRRFRLVIGSLSLALVLAGCGGISGGSTDQAPIDEASPDAPPKFDKGTAMDAIQKRGKIFVGVRSDAPPFSYRDANTGSWAGFDVEVAEVIAQNIFGKQIEGKVEWVELNALDRERALDQRRVDIALGRYSITVPRKRLVDFAGPYYQARQEIVVAGGRSRTDEITTIAELNGKKICTITGTTNLQALRERVPQADTSMQVTNDAACTAALIANQVDAIAGDHVDLADVMRDGGNRFEVLPDTYAVEPYGIGVRRGATDLRQFLNDLLEKQIGGVWDDLYTETTKDSGSKQPRVDRY